MANNTTTFTLKLKEEGLDEARKKTKDIRDNLEAAQRAASGSGSSRRFASSASARSTGMAGQSAGIGGDDVDAYNRLRGTAGASGASGRDFSDQARGLGGLVRLYATFAANIFAATAAFTALSNAMDTSNMIKGLDQLGAQSGMALGSLSKRLVTATDGAVSLREAMEATAKASSAGLNTDQILKLGNVAKTASQTLGLNMPDALSRLTRGISKLEPELLDELGIFVKIDDAVSKYALSVGKSAATLTDFERRQAFANAVLEQGAKKYGDIKIDSNPYTKLAAALKDLSFTVLELVNKGLAPLAKILAENSSLLGLVIGALAFKLVKTAIPAFGEFGSSLVRAADQASKSAKRINIAFGEAYVQSWSNKLRIPELEKEVKKIDDLLRQTGTAGLTKGEKGYTAATRLSAGQGGAKDFAVINSLISERTALYEKEIQASGGRETASTRAIKREIEGYEKLVALNKSYTATSKELASAREKYEKETVEKSASFSERARQRIVDAANSKAVAMTALSQVSANTLEMGFGQAMTRLKANLDNNVGVIRKYTTLTVGALAAATTSVGMFISSIQAWIGTALFVITGIAALLSWLSNTKKEAELTAEAFDRLTGATKTSYEVLERISKLSPLEKVSTENIQAKATAFKELGDSLELSVSRAFNQLEKMNSADKITQFFKGIFGADVSSNLAENITNSLIQAFRIAEPGKATQEAKNLVEGILQVSISSSDLERVVRELVKTGNRQAIADLSKIIQKLGNDSAVSAAKGVELRDSITKITTSIQEFNKGLLPTDSLSRYAQDAQSAAQKLKVALDDPTQRLTAMRNILKSPDALTIFTPGMASELMAYTKSLDDLAVRLERAGELSQESKDKIKELNKNIMDLEIVQNNRTQRSKQTDEQIQKLKNQVKELEQEPVNLRVKLEQEGTGGVKDVFDRGIRESLLQSAMMMGARIAAQLNKAQTVVLSALANLAGDTEVGIKLRAQLERSAIAAQAEVARQSFELALRVEELKLEMERTRLEARQKELLSRSPDRIDTQEANAISKRLEEIRKLEPVLKDRTFPQTSAQLLKAAKKDETISPELINLVQKLEGLKVAKADAAASQVAATINEQAALLANRQKVEAENLAVSTRLAQIEREREDLKKSQLSLDQDQLIVAKLLTSQKKIDEEFDQKKNKIQDDFIKLYVAGAKIYAEGVKTGDKELQLSGKKLMGYADETRLRDLNLNLQERGLALDQNAVETQKQLLAYYTKEAIARRQSLELQQRTKLEISQSVESTDLELLGLRIEYLKTEGKLIGDQLQKEETRYKLLELTTKAAQNKSKSLLDLNEKLARLSDEFNDPATTQARRTDIIREQLLYVELYNTQTTGIDRVIEARKKQLELELTLTERQKAYSSIFERTMDSMADALVEFARTGKLSFKSLIDTMIAELIRFEIRRMMTATLGTGSTIFSVISSLVTGGASGAGSGMGIDLAGGVNQAKGGVWNGGLQKFAMGGAFTNKIVDSPTLFRFARGTGLMGEAGPEAIMPLKRDPQGNLGVRGTGGGNVEVVVNNYSQERASAQETTDSRGNRRIEVTIGDMVAGEMSRTGSNSQRAVRGTFGLQPQLIRR